MALGIGVIGTRMIGQDHIRRITDVLSGGRLVAVTKWTAPGCGRGSEVGGEGLR